MHSRAKCKCFSNYVLPWIIHASSPPYWHGKSGVDCTVVSYLKGNEHNAQRC
jgi:hypothetical protein